MEDSNRSQLAALITARIIRAIIAAIHTALEQRKTIKRTEVAVRSRNKSLPFTEISRALIRRVCKNAAGDRYIATLYLDKARDDFMRLWFSRRA